MTLYTISSPHLCTYLITHLPAQVNDNVTQELSYKPPFKYWKAAGATLSLTAPEARLTAESRRYYITTTKHDLITII